jgi:hypothetical protein
VLFDLAVFLTFAALALTGEGFVFSVVLGFRETPPKAIALLRIKTNKMRSIVSLSLKGLVMTL